jgi:hypothetical protein
MQQVYKALSDIEKLAGWTPAKEGESSVSTCIVNRAEGKRTTARL